MFSSSFLYILVLFQYVKTCPVFNLVSFSKNFNTCVNHNLYELNDENELNNFLWPGAKLFFKFDESINQEHEDMLFEAMDLLEDYTCIEFYEYRSIINGYYYITITSNEKYSGLNWIGLQPNSDSMFLYVNPDNTELGHLFHKFLNALGVINEHTRPDRNKYVVVKWTNIQPDFMSLFEINKENYIDVGLPYDYGSVTHYKGNEYAKNGGLKTLLPKTKGAHTIIGQKDYISSLDVAKLNRIYNCVNKYTATDRYPFKKDRFFSILT